VTAVPGYEASGRMNRPRNGARHDRQAASLERVSVIVPCYNQAQYIEAAVDSLFAQKHTNWECIIINDGSTDNSAEVAGGLATRDSRVRVISQRNRGLATARNRGLAAATGSFIQFLDADDLLEPEKLSCHLSAFKERPELDISYGDSWFLLEGSEGERVAVPPCAHVATDAVAEFVLNWSTTLCIPVHAFLYRQSCFERWGTFDERLPTHEDWDLHLRFAAAGALYGFVPGRSSLYRIRASSMARQLDAMHRGRCLVLSKHLASSALPARYRLELARQFCAGREPYAWELLRTHQWRAAATYVLDRGLGGVHSSICVSVLIAILAYRLIRAVPRRAFRSLSRVPRPAEKKSGPDRSDV
jgi:glycosyltransferase involved in cell wall biosynthesis